MHSPSPTSRRRSWPPTDADALLASLSTPAAAATARSPRASGSLANGALWRHPCFVDAVAAEHVAPSLRAAQSSAHPPQPGLGFAPALDFVADLLVAPDGGERSRDREGDGSPEAEQAARAADALRFGAELDREVPLARRSTFFGSSKKTDMEQLLDYLKRLVGRLRSMHEGESLVVPVGWPAAEHAAGANAAAGNGVPHRSAAVLLAQESRRASVPR